MNRVAEHARTEVVAYGLSLIPARILELTGADLLVGVDPVFAGLHAYESGTTDTRSYRVTAHVAYPFHQRGLAASSRRTTIVLPAAVNENSVVREFGHVLHERLGFPSGVVPCTSYAATNPREAFAEAFTAWVVPGRGPRTLKGRQWSYAHAREFLKANDPKTLALFESLTV